MKRGGAFSDASAVVLCLRNANLSTHDKVLVLADTHGNLAVLDTKQQMCRLFGPLVANITKQTSCTKHLPLPIACNEPPVRMAMSTPPSIQRRSDK